MVQLSHYQWLDIRLRQLKTWRARQRIRGPQKRRKNLFTEGHKRSKKDNIVSFYQSPARDPKLGVALYVLSSFLP
jgi:hypothetical protein